MKALRILLVTIVVFAAVAAAYGGYEYWNRQQTIAVLRPDVKMASIRAELLMDAQLSDKGVTFVEYYAKSDAGLEEIDKAVIHIKSRASAKPTKQETAALNYLGSVQAAIRAMSQALRAMSAATNSVEFAKSRQQDLESSNEYTRTAAREWSLREIENAKQKLSESEAAHRNVKPQLDELERARPTIEAMFGKDATINPDAMKKALDNYTEKSR